MARQNIFEAIPIASRQQRPEPPRKEKLTDEETAEWYKIVDRMPHGYFTAEMFPVLTALCRHIGYARTIASRLSVYTPQTLKDPDYLDQYLRLLTAHQNESRLIQSAATKLRLTPQARYVPGIGAKIQREGALTANRALYQEPLAK